MTLGQRVAVMRDGVLQQFGDPQTLFHKPVNLFVAAFLGSPTMNLVSARCDGERVGVRGLLAAAGGVRRHARGTSCWGLRPGRSSWPGRGRIQS
jgi:multiple sugar transport system ATP-binding protein